MLFIEPLALLYSLTFTTVFSVSSLKYFETFSYIGISTRVKRSSGAQEIVKNVKFRAFQRQFHITVTSGTNVLAKGFKAHLVHGNGRRSSYFVDQSKLFSGHLVEFPDVNVNAHIEDTMWYIYIFDKNDSYAVEPANNLLDPSDNPQNDTMIVYRSSDLTNNSSKCVAESLMGDISSLVSYNVKDDTNDVKGNQSREKRSSQRNTCLLNLVGDHYLYSRRCRKNHVACTSLMISYIQNADNVYRASVFIDKNSNKYMGIGIQIAMLVLYTAPSKSEIEHYPHFNAEGIPWSAKHLLVSFARHMKGTGNQYCLSSLLTSYPLPDYVLGLAFVKSICNVKSKHSKIYLTSTSIISAEDSDSHFAPSLQINLVIVHGHNFGSAHDPNTEACSDPYGANYVMWENAVTGQYPNNKKFSPCSLRSIGVNLATVNCLVDRSEVIGICGNGIVDSGEECDAGSGGQLNFDPCCDKDCLLKPGAKCSTRNSQCCDRCNLAPEGTLCSKGLIKDCKNDSFCIGTSFDCPEPENMPDLTNCSQGGQCIKGQCVAFCEIKAKLEGLHLKSCMCISSDTAACRRCCANNTDPSNPGPCVPHSFEVFPDGQQCYKGFCKGGLCTSRVLSQMNNLYSFFTSMEISRIAMFMRTNIVTVVILLSLTLWIPFSCLIYQQDILERKEREKWWHLKSQRCQKGIAFKKEHVERRSLTGKGHLERAAKWADYKMADVHIGPIIPDSPVSCSSTVDINKPSNKISNLSFNET